MNNPPQIEMHGIPSQPLSVLIALSYPYQPPSHRSVDDAEDHSYLGEHADSSAYTPL
jgi:hypothetical protein